jgi:hypothetical protein
VTAYGGLTALALWVSYGKARLTNTPPTPPPPNTPPHPHTPTCNRSAWKVTAYGGLTALALWVSYGEAWLTDTRALWLGCTRFPPCNMYVKPELLLFYCVETGFYIQVWTVWSRDISIESRFRTSFKPWRLRWSCPAYLYVKPELLLEVVWRWCGGGVEVVWRV